MPSPNRPPLRGEIWFVQLPVDPPQKGRRPVVIVSLNVRNRHERADTVLVVPLTTSTHKEAPTHVFLAARETGLQSDSAGRAEDPLAVSGSSAINGFANSPTR